MILFSETLLKHVFRLNRSFMVCVGCLWVWFVWVCEGLSGCVGVGVGIMVKKWGSTFIRMLVSVSRNILQFEGKLYNFL